MSAIQIRGIHITLEDDKFVLRKNSSSLLGVWMFSNASHKGKEMFPRLQSACIPFTGIEVDVGVMLIRMKGEKAYSYLQLTCEQEEYHFEVIEWTVFTQYLGSPQMISFDGMTLEPRYE